MNRDGIWANLKVATGVATGNHWNEVICSSSWCGQS